MANNPKDIAEEFVEVQQVRVQSGWGNPVSAEHRHIRIEVEFPGAPEKGTKVDSVDSAERLSDKWTFRMFDPDEVIEEGKKPTALFEGNDRKAFAEKLAEATIRKLDRVGKPLKEGPVDEDQSEPAPPSDTPVVTTPGQDQATDGKKPSETKSKTETKTDTKGESSKAA